MISILIPAYNEADRIGETIASLRSSGGPLALAEIIVVDDGSTDKTTRVAEGAGADIVIRQANQGKGAALQAAYSHAVGDILLLIDADLGKTAAEASKLLHPIITEESDMTIARFPVLAGKGGGVGLVVGLARFGIKRFTGEVMQAPLSGQRGIRREVIEACGGFAAGWGVEVTLTVKAIRAGFRVQEIETQMGHRVTGRSPAAILHRARQFLAVIRVLLQLAGSSQNPASERISSKRLPEKK